MNNSSRWKELKFKDFEELKQKAFNVAKLWEKAGMQQGWLKGYIDQYAPSSTVWKYRDMIGLYSQHIIGNISLDSAQNIMNEIEKDFNTINSALKNLGRFMMELNNAFQKEQAEPGTAVSFKCPICSGDANGVRFSTPTNIAHKAAVRGKCNSCGFAIMN